MYNLINNQDNQHPRKVALLISLEATMMFAHLVHIFGTLLFKNSMEGNDTLAIIEM